MPTRSRWLPRLSLLVVSCALALGLAELGARLFDLDPLAADRGLLGREANRGDCMRPAPYLGYELVPGACGANSLGFLGPERPVDKPSGTVRVLVLGDSISEQRTWVELLEELLNERLQAPVEVWNLGVSGYGTLNELAYLQHRALDWDPDLVLLQFCLNDYQFTPVLVRYDGQLYRMAAEVDAMGPLTLWLFERFALARAVVLRAAEPQARPGFDPAHMERVDAALGTMKALCDERGVPFELVVFPELASPRDRDPGRSEAHRRVLAAASAQGLSTVDLGVSMGPGDLGELGFAYAPAVYADLEGALERWEREPSEAERLRALPKRALNLDFRHDPRRAPDRVHPNFLGHYLAARAVSERVAPLLESERSGGE
jgi:lysophospholipase L1-like esterase